MSYARGKIAMRVVFYGLLSILFAHGTFLDAQTKPPTEENQVIRVDTELVDVPLSVTNKAGRPITNLTQKNFVVYEDGKLQKVEEFTTVSAPFEVALILDTSGSTRADLELIRRAARDFVASLRPGDRVSIIAFRSIVRDNRSVSIPDVVNQLTDNRVALQNAIDRVSMGNGTPFYDSLLAVTEKVFTEAPKEEFRGRRALVALTDGVDSSSLDDFQQARTALVSEGVSSYFININTREFFEDRLLGDCESVIRFSQAQINRYYATFGKGSKIEKASNFCQLGDFERLAVSKKLYEIAEMEMNDLAKISGGRVFPAADLTEARTAFKQVATEIGTRYSLGYSPTNETRDGKFRTIKVELKGLPPGATVRAREGYTAPTN